MSRNWPKSPTGAAGACTDAASGAEVSQEIDQLMRLAELHEQGILTDEEFQAKKAQILGLD